MQLRRRKQNTKGEKRRLKRGQDGMKRQPTIADISFRVNFVEVKGPFQSGHQALDRIRKKVFVCGHLTGQPRASCARTILTSFARKAYRRNPSAARRSQNS